MAAPSSVEASVAALLMVLRCTATGEADKCSAKLRLLQAQLGQCLAPVHPRHIEVNESYARIEECRDAKTLGPTKGDCSFEAQDFEQVTHGRGGVDVVVDHHSANCITARWGNGWVKCAQRALSRSQPCRRRGAGQLDRDARCRRKYLPNHDRVDLASGDLRGHRRVATGRDYCMASVQEVPPALNTGDVTEQL